MKMRTRELSHYEDDNHRQRGLTPATLVPVGESTSASVVRPTRGYGGTFTFVLTGKQRSKSEMTRLPRRALSLGSTTVGAATVLICLMAPPTANADTVDGSLNGRYIATSNGDWAMTNDQYRNETSVRSTWTISSSCVNPTDCVGTMTSDLGWTADIYKKAGMWYVRRELPGWQPCPDGTAADGLQMFRFYAGDPMTGEAVPAGANTYLGEDITTSAGGACGINKQLVVKMPFKMVAA